MGLILVSDPGSASRKYGLYDDTKQLASIHFEFEGSRVVGSVAKARNKRPFHAGINDFTGAITRALEIFKEEKLLGENELPKVVGIRLVAPGSEFQKDHLVDEVFIAKLETLASHAPQHIKAMINEIKAIELALSGIPIYAVSDSAFHTGKPDYAKYYGLPKQVADQFGIYRFGYHGLSVESVVDNLLKTHKLPARVIVCHLGSGASVTAVYEGRSVDCTMGYSPLEGLVMASRAGSVDSAALMELQKRLGFTDEHIVDYLNNKSGLLGLSGISNDIRELLVEEAKGNEDAEFALSVYVFNAVKAIAQMAGAISGIDMLVFTGTVGERSAPMRERIIEKLHFLDLLLDKNLNYQTTSPLALTSISLKVSSKPIYVIPTKELDMVAEHVRKLY